MFLTANMNVDFSNVALPMFDSSLEYDEVNEAVSSDMDTISTENELDENSDAMELDADDNQTPRGVFRGWFKNVGFRDQSDASSH